MILTPVIRLLSGWEEETLIDVEVVGSASEKDTDDSCWARTLVESESYHVSVRTGGPCPSGRA